MKVTPGTVIGRLTVIKRLPPAKRCHSDDGVRGRCLVRCVCGREKIVWDQDCTRRLSGCGSLKCSTRQELANDLKHTLDGLAKVDTANRSLLTRLKMRIDAWLGEQSARDREVRAMRMRGDDGLGADDVASEGVK
jgi:hypothetical protein